MTKAHLAGQSILDVLRPPVGWKTDRALLSSYSADLAVIAAALLALPVIAAYLFAQRTLIESIAGTGVKG